jgi:hypothetical protein
MKLNTDKFGKLCGRQGKFDMCEVEKFNKERNVEFKLEDLTSFTLS